MSAHREIPNVNDASVSHVIAAGGDDRRARLVAGVIVGAGLLMSVALSLAEGDATTGVLYLGVGGIFALIMYVQLRTTLIVVTRGVFSAQATMKRFTCGVDQLRSAQGQYGAPNATLQAGAVLISGERLSSQATLTLMLDTGPENIGTATYAQTSDLIARRLRRFLRRGPEELRPTAQQVARQVERNPTTVTYTGSTASQLSGSRLVEIGPAGLRVGNDEKKLWLYSWQYITAAHLVHGLEGDEMIEVELANGRCVRMRGAYDLARDEMVMLLAPRAYDLQGKRIKSAAQPTRS